TSRMIISTATLYDAFPLRIRVPSGEPVPISKLFLQHHFDGEPYAFEWMKRMEIPREIAVQMLEGSPDRPSEMLRLICELSLSWPRGLVLQVAGSKHDKWLALVEVSDDPQLIRGALELLIGVQFERILGADLLEKLVRIGSAENDKAAALFGGFGVRRMPRSEQTEALVTGATGVVGHPTGVHST